MALWNTVHLSCGKKRHLRNSLQRRGSKRKLVCLKRNRTVVEGSTFFKQEEACVWLMTGEKDTVDSGCCRRDNGAHWRSEEEDNIGMGEG